MMSLEENNLQASIPKLVVGVPLPRGLYVLLSKKHQDVRFFQRLLLVSPASNRNDFLSPENNKSFHASGDCLCMQSIL